LYKCLRLHGILADAVNVPVEISSYRLAGLPSTDRSPAVSSNIHGDYGNFSVGSIMPRRAFAYPHFE
jgi:hypothetical protein